MITKVQLDRVRNVAVAGLVVAVIALSVNALGILNAQTHPPTVNSGDVISLIGSHDVYVAVIDGDTRYKRQFDNPEVFIAYEHRSWGDVLAVSSTVFDSFETRGVITSVSDALALATSVRSTTSTTPTAPTGTTGATTSVDESAIMARIQAAGNEQVARINSKADERIAEIRSTSGRTSSGGTTISNRQVERIYERIRTGDKAEVDTYITRVDVEQGDPTHSVLSASWSKAKGSSVSYEVSIGKFEVGGTTYTNTQKINTTNHTFTGLLPDTLYFVKVRAIVSGKHGSPQLGSGRTSPAVLSDDIPVVRDITITTPNQNTDTTLNVSWAQLGGTDVPDNTYFEVHYKGLYTYRNYLGSNVESILTNDIKKVISGTSTTLTGLLYGTKYEVKVRARTDEVFGEFSASATKATTFTTTPENVRVLYKGVDKLRFGWDTLGEHYTYEYSYKETDDTEWTTQPVVGASSVDPTPTSVDILLLKENTSYDFKIRGVSKGKVKGTETEAISATTKQSPFVSTLYMVGKTNQKLYTINANTSTATQVGSTTAGFGVSETSPQGLAVSPDGKLYMVGAETDALYTLNQTTGAATQVGTSTDFGTTGQDAIDNPAGLAFVGEKLYMIDSTLSRLYELNTQDGTATRVGSIDEETEGAFGIKKDTYTTDFTGTLEVPLPANGINPTGLTAIGDSLYMRSVENRCTKTAGRCTWISNAEHKLYSLNTTTGQATLVTTLTGIYATHAKHGIASTGNASTIYTLDSSNGDIKLLDITTGLVKRISETTQYYYFGVSENKPRGLATLTTTRVPTIETGSTTKTTTSITISWDAQPEALNYQVQYCVLSGGSCNADGWQDAGGTTTSTSKTISSLTASTNYRVRVGNVRTGHITGWSETQDVSTPAS